MDYGILNEAVFHNNACAIITMLAPFNNSNTFTNEGLFTVNTLGIHLNTGFVNNGVIVYPQGNPIPNVTNNDFIVAPIVSECAEFQNALQKGGVLSFTAAPTWYKDQGLTMPAGTYNQTPPTPSPPPTWRQGGTYTLYFSIGDDANNCPRTVSIKVTYDDLTPPTITCPANINKNSDPGQCTAVTHYVVTAMDNCSFTLMLTAGLVSGSAFPAGVTAVEWKATDPGGSMTTCAFTVTVTVVDNTPPSISCPPSKSQGTAVGTCSALVEYATPTATDNCTANPMVMHVSGGTGTVQGAPNSSATFNKGINTVVWKAVDAAGNTKTCTFRVVVNDLEAPTLNCPPTINANTAAGLCSATVSYTNPSFTDNCAPTSGTAVRIGGPASGSAFPAGRTK